MWQRARIQLRPGLLAFSWVATQLAAVPLYAAPAPIAASSQQEYWAQFDRRDWDAAIASAEQLIAPLRPATAANGLRLAEALSLLGNAQLGKGNLVAAESSFSEALQLTQERVSDSSSRLLDPLRGLGYALASEGKHAAAVPYLDRALLLSRRNGGLFDPSQQGLLRQLATSQTLLGQLAQAERHMLYLLRVGEHAYGANDPRMSSVRCLIGDWYAQIGQMDPARQYYRAALTIVEKKLGHGSLATVLPLRSLAQSYTDEVRLSHLGLQTRSERTPANFGGGGDGGGPLNPKYLATEGERALLRALHTLENDPQRSSRTLQETLLQTGDWYLMKQLPSQAFPYYERAAALNGKEDLQTASVPALSFPAQVYYPTPSLAARNITLSADEANERYVRVEFTVLPDGSVKDARIAEADATDRQKTQTLEAIGDARYRPKFTDGKPVETKAMSYRQVFRERKETEKESD